MLALDAGAFIASAHPVPAETFAHVPGVSDLEIHRDVVRCGPVDALIKTVARYDVVDVQSRQPGLEELFLANYRNRAEDPR